MAQSKRDLTAMMGSTVKDCLPDDERNDTVTDEGLALVRARAQEALAGRTFRSVNDAKRIVQFR